MTNIRELPEHLLATIFAHLPRWDYPNLAYVCREFRSAIRSQELYVERHRIHNTESVLYALIGYEPTQPTWYILNKKNVPLRLNRIGVLDSRPYGSGVVTIGFYIYVFGGNVGVFVGNVVDNPTSGVFRIDCRTHEIHELPSMSRDRYGAAAGVVDGKIYVIGGCEMGATNDWVEVFTVETQSWSAQPGPYIDLVPTEEEIMTCVVMQDKIYVRDCCNCFTYEPKHDQWENRWGGEFTSLSSLWRPCSCVVDDVLYSLEPQFYIGSQIVSFDPEENYWRPVEIINQFPLPFLHRYEAKMANVGGNLVILAGNNSHKYEYCGDLLEIWCIEITLERHEDGSFTGTTVRVECVRTPVGTRAPYIEHCLAITV